MRATFPHADDVTLVCGLQVVVFNVGGNNIRVVAVIFYDRPHQVHVKRVLTHPEYDRGNWKEQLCRE